MMDRLREVLLKYPLASQRFLEILPGFVSWNFILFPVWGALFFPELVGVFLLTFYLYWLYRSGITAFRAWVSYQKIREEKSRDFLGELARLKNADRVRHIVVIPTYNEPVETLVRTLDALAVQTLGPEKIIPVVAFEERAGETINAPRELLIRQKFASVFPRLIFTYHPSALAGEVVGKSSNMAWAARELNQLVEKEETWDRDFLTISSADADVCFHPSHFAALSWYFLTSSQPHRRIWQGAMMFYNNIDRIPMFMRVFNRLFTVVAISGLRRQDGMLNFSTYSLSWKLLEDIGFWDVDVIPEDFRIFFKAYFGTKGTTRVEPIYLPVLADAAEARGFWPTFVNTYQQVKRWAWGCSDDAYILKRWAKDKEIPFWEKSIRVLRVLEIHFLWPVNWFLLTVSLPILGLLNKQFMSTPFGQLLPDLAGWILSPTVLALLVFLFVDLRSQPNFRHLPLWRKMLYPVELFVITPISGLLFSALPGLEAHTRLLLGKYIEYRVTEKI
ncbi:MAG: glycosyltransferase family 2 protein [Spirochaetales bacterium]|nr:glycosyltransferase family 2 protein [Spirochaetales bacterium]